MCLKNIRKYILLFSCLGTATLTLENIISVGKEPITLIDIIKTYISAIMIAFLYEKYLSLIENKEVIIEFIDRWFSKFETKPMLVRWFSNPKIKPILLLLLWFMVCVFCIFLFGVPLVSLAIVFGKFVLLVDIDKVSVLNMYIYYCIFGGFGLASAMFIVAIIMTTYKKIKCTHVKFAKILLLNVACLLSSSYQDADWYPSADLAIENYFEYLPQTEEKTDAKSIAITFTVRNTSKMSIVASTITFKVTTGQREYLQTVSSNVRIIPNGIIAISSAVTYLDNLENFDSVSIVNTFFE